VLRLERFVRPGTVRELVKIEDVFIAFVASMVLVAIFGPTRLFWKLTVPTNAEVPVVETVDSLAMAYTLSELVVVDTAPIVLAPTYLEKVEESKRVFCVR
jgi:hypothetical protein